MHSPTLLKKYLPTSICLRIAKLLAAALSCAVFTPQAKAEYRVFKVVINDKASGTSRTVISNLDHLQYPGYFPLRKTETIELQATWMCWGSTADFKAYCPQPPPPAAASARVPASVPASGPKPNSK
jgi:hypothetical protein